MRIQNTNFFQIQNSTSVETQKYQLVDQTRLNSLFNTSAGNSVTDPGNVTMTADHLCLLQGKRPTRVFHGKFLNNNNNNNKKGEEGARRKQEDKIHVLPDRRVEFRSNKAQS